MATNASATSEKADKSNEKSDKPAVYERPKFKSTQVRVILDFLDTMRDKRYVHLMCEQFATDHGQIAKAVGGENPWLTCGKSVNKEGNRKVGLKSEKVEVKESPAQTLCAWYDRIRELCSAVWGKDLPDDWREEIDVPIPVVLKLHYPWLFEERDYETFLAEEDAKAKAEAEKAKKS